jgi:hypothetical protein
MDNDEQLLLPNMGSGLLFNKDVENADDEGLVISHDLDLRQMNTDMDDNGLIFLPDCTDDCFKGKKVKCDHHQKNVQINNVKNYILFPSTCLHHGYYNDEANKIFITTQIFAKPYIEPDTKGLTRSFTQSQDFIQSKLNELTIKELSNDLLLNCDSTYSADEFPWDKGFDGLTVDWESNRQITNTNLNKVPLIRELVNTFVELFPYLSIDMVWLRPKKNPGDGFQGWHKDKEEQELKAMGENLCKEFNMDLHETKLMSH